MPSVHEQVVRRLAGLEQRYTPMRQALVVTVAAAERPLSVPEILALSVGLPQSSAYRNVKVLIDAGVVRRVSGLDDHDRFELAEELAGQHHHLICGSCGKVEDVTPSSRLKRAMAEAPAWYLKSRAIRSPGTSSTWWGCARTAARQPTDPALRQPRRVRELDDSQVWPSWRSECLFEMPI
jgi:Fur family ferric uptake transcriptional regulator